MIKGGEIEVLGGRPSKIAKMKNRFADKMQQEMGERNAGVEDMPVGEVIIDNEPEAERREIERIAAPDNLLMIVAYIAVTLLFGYLIYSVVKNLHRDFFEAG